MGDSLLEFFRSAKAQGASDQTLVELLKRQGWSERQVFGAVQAYYEAQTGLQLPQHASSWESARDAFVYLLSFIALCSWVWSLGSLWFEFIDLALPDPIAPAFPSYSARSDLASALSGLIVGLPVYLLCLRTLGREVSRNPDKLDSGIRKWLTYMAMLIGAGVILGDLINFLNHFLRGELALRFVLKSLAVFALAGCILWYHLGAVGRALDISRIATRDRAYSLVLIAAAFVSVVVGFWNLGSPATLRLVEADLQRSAHLARIASELHSYWSGKHALPSSLTELSPTIRTTGPFAGQNYEYRILSGSSYELCAEFATDSGGDRQNARNNARNNAQNGRFSIHAKGRQCFTVDAAVASP